MTALSFSAGITNGNEQCLNVSILDDNDALEGNQMFTVALMESDDGVMLDNNMTTITITDNEGKG